MTVLRPRLTRRAAAAMALALALASAGLAALSPSASAAALTFDGNFDAGLSAWNATGGGAQCANYGQPSQNQRLRGNFVLDSSVAGPGVTVGRFDLPASTPSFPMEACELTHPVSLNLGSDQYYGYMFYVPTGWSDGTSDFWGITVAQFQFQNIWGSPIEFELHTDHMTLALETGACNSYTTSAPGCQYRSNADAGGCVSNATRTCLAAQYAVPPPMQQGVWHELIMHVHWASDSSGQIQVWHRIAGQANWTQTVNWSGYPTAQWDVTQGCCSSPAVDKVGAYRGQASAPVSVWEDDILDGPDFATVDANLALSALVSAPAPPTPVVAPVAPVAPPSSNPAPPAPHAPASKGAHSASARPIHIGPACILGPRWHAWLRHHRRPSPKRHRMLAMRRVVVHRRRWAGARHHRRLVSRPVAYYCVPAPSPRS